MKRHGKKHTVRVRRHGRFNIRKFISSLMSFMLMLAIAVPICAAEENKPVASSQKPTAVEKAIEKLAEGIEETATGWTEVPKEMIETGKKTNPIEGVTVGTVKGAGAAVVETTEGAVKTGTFYIPEESAPAVKDK